MRAHQPERPRPRAPVPASRLLLPLVVATPGLSCVADVRPYVAEVELSRESVSEDLATGVAEREITGAAARAALRPVPAAWGPVDEALFLARVPYVGLSWDEREPSTPSLTDCVTIAEASVRHADTSVPVTSGVVFTHGEQEYTNSYWSRWEAAGVRLGYFLAPGVEVGVAYGEEEGAGFMGAYYEYRVETAEAYFKAVAGLSGGRAVNFEAKAATHDHHAGPGWVYNEIEVAADCYLSRLVSVGGTVIHSSGSDIFLFGTGFELHLRANAGTRLGVRCGVRRFVPEDTSVLKEETTLGASLVVRM